MSVVWSYPEPAVALLCAVLAGARPAVSRRRATPRGPRDFVSADPRFGILSTAVFTAVLLVPGTGTSGPEQPGASPPPTGPRV